MPQSLQLKEVEDLNGIDGVIEDTSGHANKITASGLMELLEKQSKRCALTGRELQPDTASLDHAIPLSRGGKNTICNCQIVHRDVNQAKSTMTTNEFITLCREVVAWIDRNDDI